MNSYAAYHVMQQGVDAWGLQFKHLDCTQNPPCETEGKCRIEEIDSFSTDVVEMISSRNDSIRITNSISDLFKQINEEIMNSMKEKARKYLVKKLIGMNNPFDRYSYLVGQGLIPGTQWLIHNGAYERKVTVVLRVSQCQCCEEDKKLRWHIWADELATKQFRRDNDVAHHHALLNSVEGRKQIGNAIAQSIKEVKNDEKAWRAKDIQAIKQSLLDECEGRPTIKSRD